MPEPRGGGGSGGEYLMVDKIGGGGIGIRNVLYVQHKHLLLGRRGLRHEGMLTAYCMHITLVILFPFSKCLIGSGG